MATPLTDSINALTTYANSVTGATDTTLSDAVYTLAQGFGQGGDNFFAYANSLFETFVSKTLPETVDIDFEGAVLTSLYRAFDYTTGVKTITLRNIGARTQGMALNYFARRSTATTINFVGDAIKPSIINNFIESSSVETINGTFDLSALTTSNVPYGAFSTVLKDISFVASTISVDISLVISSALSDASLVSIANGLNEDVTGKTLTLHATPLARCSTLMGTVTDGTFTADASGSVTLADFITNTKGWTLA